MLHRKIIGVISVVVFGICSFITFDRYKDNKRLEEYINDIDLNILDNNILIIEKDGSVSIDVVVFKLEVERLVYNVSSSLNVRFIELDRYSNMVVLEYGYEDVTKKVSYELSLGEYKISD